MSAWSIVTLSEVIEADRLDSEYFRPDSVAIEAKVNSFSHKTLGQIAPYINRGTQPEYSEEGTIPVLRTVNIREEEFSSTRQQFVTKDFHDQKQRGQVYKGDILITSTGVGTLGRVAYNHGSNLLFADGHITIVRGIDGFNPLFVATFLQSRVGKSLIERRQRGSSGQIEIYPTDIASIPVPELPRTSQEEIASKSLEAWRKHQQSKVLYAEVEAALLKELDLDTLDLSTKTTYTAMFSETLEANRLDAEHFQSKYLKVVKYLSANWPTEKIGRLGEVLKGRSTGSYADTGIPVIRSGDLNDLDDLSSLKYASPSKQLFYLQQGDVCISSIGFGSIGKVQVFDKLGAFATVSEVTVVRQKRVNPYYLQIFLQSPAGQLQIERWITGATGQLHLYPKDVEKIVVSILPEEKQEEFEYMVMKSRQAKQEAKRILEEAKQRVEQLVLCQR
jgi:prepilin-type processing-associated H-X9-DG protein